MRMYLYISTALLRSPCSIWTLASSHIEYSSGASSAFMVATPGQVSLLGLVFVHCLTLLLAPQMKPLQPARLAGFGAAIRGLAVGEGFLVFPLQEGNAGPHIDMRPGQHLIQRTLAVGIKRRVQAAPLESSQPVGVVEMLAPGIKVRTQLPGTVDDLTEPP